MEGFRVKRMWKNLKSWALRMSAFQKKCNMKITDMVKSSWVYENLLNWRAGIVRL